MKHTFETNPFQKQKRQFKLIFGGAILLFVIIGLMNFFVMSGKTGVKAIITTGHGKYADTYYVTDYREHDGCVEFTDNFNMTHKVCGNYQLTQTK